MHSKICCQIYGLDYVMFEDIRNYKCDTELETKQNIENLFKKWENTEYIKASEKLLNKNFTLDTFKDFASQFELMRKKAKVCVFGTVYGVSSLGLAEQLDISKEEAQKLIDGFKMGLPYYLQWEKKVHDQTLKLGYVECILGRKRRFGKQIEEAKKTPEFKKQGFHWLISRSLRQSLNAIIQSSSASQSKKAMIDLFYPIRPDGTRCLDRREWLEKNYQSVLEKNNSYILLQIHDEISILSDINTPYEAYEEFAKIIGNTIPSPIVEFKSDIEVSTFWGGKLSKEEYKKLQNGELDKEELFRKESIKKLQKFDSEYTLGDFMESYDEEDVD